jgi:tRNA-splicing ligase RtcB
VSIPLAGNVKAWLAKPLPPGVARAVERIASAEDVRHVAVMPDVHLARDVCVGLVVATRKLIYPAAVGSDIGCGIAAIGFDVEADAITRDGIGYRLFTGLHKAVPIHRHRSGQLPEELINASLSDQRLDTIRRRDGSVQFATLGRGNHFLEFQRDGDGRLWLMVHSGSRAIGQAIRDFHEGRDATESGRLVAIDAESDVGSAYLADARWARTYAKASRRAMIDTAGLLLRNLIGAAPEASTYFDCDHNHVRRESHFGTELWVHRKGAMSADEGKAGSIPGSMGTETYHVTGRGNAESLRSSSHGAGRAMSREEARRTIKPTQLNRQMRGVLFGRRWAGSLCEEAPAAYNDVKAVIRAQAQLTRVVRRLRPVLVYKGHWCFC